MQRNKNKSICNWCGQPTNIIWVHGHGQCRFCGTNIDECCRGELCDPPSDNPSQEKSVSKKSADQN